MDLEFIFNHLNPFFSKYKDGIDELSPWLKEYDSYHRLFHRNPIGVPISEVLILNSSKCVAERSICLCSNMMLHLRFGDIGLPVQPVLESRARNKRRCRTICLYKIQSWISYIPEGKRFHLVTICYSLLNI